MKYKLNESKRRLSDEENKFFQDIFNGWKNNPYALWANWDKSINDFCNQHGIIPDFTNPIPEDYIPNHIHLLMANEDNGSQAACFFRHFRNAFDHEHILIVSPGEMLMAYDGDIKKSKKDENGNQMEVFVYKMRCLCPFKFFQELTYRLLSIGKQRFETIVK